MTRRLANPHGMLRRGMLLFLAVWACRPTLSYSGPPSIPDKTQLPFEEKLRYYLDQNTQDIVEELLAREIQLLQLVNGMYGELLVRGDQALPAFQSITQERDRLIESYGSELASLLHIYDDLDRLQRIAEYGGDLRALKVIDDNRDSIKAAMDHRKLYKKGIYSPERVGGMIDSYTAELDTLLGMHDTLEFLKVRARANNDTLALEQIADQQKNLMRVFSSWGGLGPLNEEDYIRYQIEVEKIAKVAGQIDKVLPPGEAAREDDLLRMKKQLMNKLDASVFDLLSRSGYDRNFYPTISAYIDAWKGERTVDILTRLAEYQAVRKKLLASGAPADIERLFADQISNALLNFADGLYLTAEYQLRDAMETWPERDKFFTSLKYYIGESRHHRQALEGAREFYLKVLEDPTPSIYHAESLVRLMQYAADFEGTSAFLNYYNHFLEMQSVAPRQLVDYAHYLTANRYFDNAQFHQTKEALLQIESGSEFFLPAQLLLSVVYLNLDETDSAIPILEMLVDRASYPWTNLNTAYIRNTALLRLGMLYYQRGNFLRAQTLFQEVSKGYSGFDKALLGQAWIALEQGDYSRVIENSHSLLRNYLASNFTYEALALSAHCQRILGQSEEALHAYRYVVRARHNLDMQQEFDRERATALDQVRELDRLERDALETRREDLFLSITGVRQELNEFLLRVKGKSDTGNLLLQDYYDERMDILRHLDKTDEILEWAEKENRPDIAAKAMQQRARLVRVLETFQADQDVVNTAYLVDFPLVAKEGGMIYRRENLASVYRDLELEKRRLQVRFDEIEVLQSRAADQGTFSDRLDLELLEKDLVRLQDRLSAFRKWMVEVVPDEPASQLDRWSDFSGFEITDIIYRSRQEKLEQINTFTTQIQTIESIFRARKQAIEERLEQFEAEVAALQQVWLEKKIALEQQEKQTYFDKYYFDVREREEEDWENRLRELIER
ncbi:tetratricopeptide repeat protein [candidate division KSB1 bacterium]|nr:tetratricopeptide repeat protein [candidate division KSB1 bacterium]